MIRKHGRKKWRLVSILLALISLSACSRIGQAADPGEWGYTCSVTYNALGGVINTKGVRETYYMPGSLLYQPAGTTGLLIRPKHDGYILAGWYTAKKDVTNANGDVTYVFDSNDRWDFHHDRVEEDITLYARWIKQGEAKYVDPSTGDVMFSKRITSESPITKLSAGTLRLVHKPGYSMTGYFQDAACTIPYDFTAYEHSTLLPTEKDLYQQLQEEFPDVIKDIDYTPPEPEKDEEGNLITPINPQHYLNKMGFMIDTEDELVLEEIRTRKNEIIEASIKAYEENTAGRIVYLSL